MAVTDLWHTKSGTPSKRYGRGLRYRASWRGHTESYRTKRAAEAAELRMRTAPPLRPKDSTTVGDLVDLWLAGKAGLSRKGLEAATGAAKHVRDEYGPEIAADLRQWEIQAWIAGFGHSASLRHKLMQCLSGACRIGVQSGALDRNPCDGVKVPKAQAREGRYLTPAEVSALAAAAGRSGPMVRFLAYTGVRIGEACALNVGDVTAREVGKGTVYRARIRRSKSGRPRDVPVPASLYRQLDLARPASAPLFTAPKGGRVSKDTWRSRVFKPAREAAGLGDLRPHDLRHTAASLMIASGASVLAVRDALGHASAKMTLDLYSHLLEGSIDDVSARMDAVVSKA